jgi:hypothetical protein
MPKLLCQTKCLHSFHVSSFIGNNEFVNTLWLTDGNECSYFSFKVIILFSLTELRNKHNQLDIHTFYFYLRFIMIQVLNMFRQLLVYLQETLHERRFGDCCVLGSLPTSRHQATSTTAHNNHQTCVRVLSPEDGQVILETCRDFES